MIIPYKILKHHIPKATEPWMDPQLCVPKLLQPPPPQHLTLYRLTMLPRLSTSSLCGSQPFKQASGVSEKGSLEELLYASSHTRLWTWPQMSPPSLNSADVRCTPASSVQTHTSPRLSSAQHSGLVRTFMAGLHGDDGDLDSTAETGEYRGSQRTSRMSTNNSELPLETVFLSWTELKFRPTFSPNFFFFKVY